MHDVSVSGPKVRRREEPLSEFHDGGVVLGSLCWLLLAHDHQQTIHHQTTFMNHQLTGTVCSTLHSLGHHVQEKLFIVFIADIILSWIKFDSVIVIDSVSNNN